MMTDVAACRSGVNHHHISRSDEAAKNCFIGIGTAYGSDLGMIAFEKDLQVRLELIFNFVNI